MVTRNPLTVVTGRTRAFSATDTIPNTAIADASVVYAKLQNVSATDRVLGRSAAGAGVTQEIVMTAAGRNLMDDGTPLDQRNTLGLGPLATLANTDRPEDRAGGGGVYDNRLFFKQTDIANANVVVSNDGDLEYVTDTAQTGARIATLPVVTDNEFRILIFKDTTGSLSETNSLTLDAAANGAVFEGIGAGTIVLNAPFQAICIQANRDLGVWNVLWRYDRQVRIDPRTEVVDADYTVLPTDSYIFYSSISAARDVFLPNISLVSFGAFFIIADETSGGGDIRVQAFAGDTLDYGGSFTLPTARHGCLQITKGVDQNWMITSYRQI